MKKINYFTQYFLILLLFSIFKILGIKLSLIISSFIFSILGPIIKKNKISKKNLTYAFKNMNDFSKEKVVRRMWKNYGKIFAEYMFIKDFRLNPKFLKKVNLENSEILNEIKMKSEPVIFVSGHFSNFELMAMSIEKYGIDLAAVYRPLNNYFLNPIMVNIRKKYICKNQIQKGISGTKNLLKSYKNGSSIAIMIDQRVSEGIQCDFFEKKALTTTIPAQFVKKFNCKIIPVYIERLENNNFKIEFNKPLIFNKDESIEQITLKLNQNLEKMILKNPDQWIWTHNRWR